MADDQDVVDFDTWQQLAGEMAALPLLVNAPLSERHATQLIDDLYLHEKSHILDLEWSQFPGCGPAAEVFGDVVDQRVLELGCGIGANAAALARCGAMVHGVDVAVENIIQVRMQFAERESGLTFTSCSVEDFLATLLTRS